MRAVLIALAVMVSGAAHAATCEAFEAKASRLSQGECSIKDIPGEKYTQDVTVNGRTFRIQYVDRQGQFHRWTIDGRPAAGYEINRMNYCGWTDDLDLSVCFDMSSKRRRR